MLQIELVNLQGETTRINLDQPEYLIGRDPTLPIVLPDGKVSRRHARIFSDASQYFIEDLGSSNGVVYEGALLTAPLSLQPGQHFIISGFAFHVVQPVAATANTFTLFALSGPGVGQGINLSQGRLSVGRAKDNDLAVDDGSISRHHAVLVVDDKGVQLEDLHSSNGTFVNDIRVTKQLLAPTDMVRFGSILYELRGPRHATTKPLRTGQTAWGRPPPIWAYGIGVACGLVCFALTFVYLERFGAKPVTLSPSEQQYVTRLRDGLAHAQSLAQATAWDASIAAYHKVLDQDPINPDARAGLADSEAAREHSAALQRASDALAQYKPLAALDALSVPSGSTFYASATQKLIQTARTAAIKERLGVADAACKRGAWQLCQSVAAALMPYAPGTVSALALIGEAESAMRAHHLNYTPYNPSPKNPIAAFYSDLEVRAAIFRYASGDFDTSSKRLRAYVQRPGAKVALEQLQSFHKERSDGDKAAAAQSLGPALQAWERALIADNRLVQDAPSALGQQVRSRIVSELQSLGGQAFDRGQYVDAFNLWRRGLYYDKANETMMQALNVLEQRAQNALTDLVTLPALNREACSRLQELLKFTRAQSPVHSAVQRTFAACRTDPSPR